MCFRLLSIFLIDHAWTFQPQSARQQLSQIPELATRMASLMNLIALPTDLVVGNDDDEKDSYDADSESGVCVGVAGVVMGELIGSHMSRSWQELNGHLQCRLDSKC